MSERRRRGRLDAAELAETAVLGDLALVLALAAWFLPVLGGLLFLAASVPYAVLASRRRLRAVVVGVVTTGLLAFVVGGISFVLNLAGVAGVGAAVGIAHRRGYRQLGSIGSALALCWIPAAIATDVFLAIFSEARKLTLEQVEVATRSTVKFLEHLHRDDLARALHDNVHWALDHWWLTIPIGELLATIVAALICRRIAYPALRRVDATFTRVEAAPAVAESGGDVAPLPVTLERVGYRYPDAPVEALADVDLTITSGTFVAIVGDNGSGKSTLASVLAGTPPTRGRVTRPGEPGIGRTGGTARVFQRPESQVVGARVTDDVRFGFAPGEIADDTVASLLARVGLAGFDERDTSTLSGGELQRLAIASALARRPALLLSDESTAMLDPDGRELVLDLLVGLRDDGITVVHITHELVEAERADVVVVLADGRVHAIGPPDDVLARRGGVQ